MIFSSLNPNSFHSKNDGRRLAQNGNKNDWSKVVTWFIYFLWLRSVKRKEEETWIDFPREFAILCDCLGYTSRVPLNVIRGLFGVFSAKVVMSSNLSVSNFTLIVSL